ncbi:MAG: 23S rRNA pseudouridine(1911/1915/1917) synthase RluD [Legionellales bacterium]|nr:23S rRNA pseudouridine(1911/1915/1917) synthase RluD [Legionellales bacterium]
MTQLDQTIILHSTLQSESRGKRLDQAVAEIFSDYSRTRLQEWIKNGQLTVNGVVQKTKYIVQGGEEIAVKAQALAQENWTAQPIPLTVVYEDEAILVINKPAGLVVHPGAGNFDHTLVNALLHYSAGLAHLPRAGIVHRLDKDTTGLLVIAKTLAAHTHLVNALQAREITREYECLVNGIMISGGTVDAPIGRNPHDRLKQAVTPNGRHAVTHYRVLGRFDRHTHLQVQLETGRTHQIRVHMAHLHHPIVGDTNYGYRLFLPPQAPPELEQQLRGFKRPALHARRLILAHPVSKIAMTFEAPLPDDMQQLIDTFYTQDTSKC